MYNFAQNEVLPNIRTKFKDVWNHKTTGNTGEIIPIYYKEVLPKDYIKLKCSSLTKMTTPSFQTMDVIFEDKHFYFVPRRLLWKNWKAFQGEKNVGPHETMPEYTVPHTTAPTEIWYEVAQVDANTSGTYYTKSGDTYTEAILPGDYVSGATYYEQCTGWNEHTLADYFGIPTKKGNFSVDSAYFRAYALIYNEYYRDQNRQDFTAFDDDDSDVEGSNGSNVVTDPILGGKPLRAAKLSDYFTRSLLQPQAGEPVKLPLGKTSPVISNGRLTLQATTTGATLLLTGDPSGTQPNSYGDLGYYNNSDTTVGQNGALNYKSGLIVDLSNATAATVNELRMAFQLQKIFEANNRSGTRYIEILRNRWNVIASDASLQRPEFLGGERTPLNMEMVVQTSSTNVESPLGQISGFSNTFDNNVYFSKGFEEHGVIIGVAIIRHQRTYQQGLSKFFSRRTMEDFYMPEFQNLGEQPIYNKEIYLSGNQTKDNEVFGYNEYAAEYRFTHNRVTGQFRSNARKSLDNWHYADDYSSTPTNGAEWIVENEEAVNRTLTVPSETTDQFQFDFQFEEEEVRTMPPHSIPGFIDHH